MVYTVHTLDFVVRLHFWYMVCTYECICWTFRLHLCCVFHPRNYCLLVGLLFRVPGFCWCAVFVYVLVLNSSLFAAYFYRNKKKNSYQTLHACVAEPTRFNRKLWLAISKSRIQFMNFAFGKMFGRAI